VKYLDKKLEQLKTGLTSDAGRGTSGTWIAFDPMFIESLSGELPLISVTATSPNQGYYVGDITVEGFKVEGTIAFNFHWEAKKENTERDYVMKDREALISSIDPTLLEHLEVSKDKKQESINYFLENFKNVQEQLPILEQHFHVDDPNGETLKNRPEDAVPYVDPFWTTPVKPADPEAGRIEPETGTLESTLGGLAPEAADPGPDTNLEPVDAGKAGTRKEIIKE
jgi:hypothetical protein